MKAVYRDDTDKGPGYGFLDISEARLGTMEGLRFSIKRGTDQNSLGVAGWQPAENPLPAQGVSLTDDGFAVGVGPEVVDHLDTRENYRLTLVCSDDSKEVGSLRVPEVTYSPIGGGQGIGMAVTPEPKAVPPPPLVPKPPEPEPEPVVDILPPPAEPPAAKKGSMMPVIIGILVLALAGGGFAAWKLLLDKEQPPVAAEEKKEPESPPKPALAQAREHLAGKADPKESVTLAKKLREDKDGGDAAFLLVEDAAQKGDAEAMLLTGGYFDPADSAPSGTIKKDPAEALSWYKKAKDAGNAEADARMASLRAWAELETARGSPEAKDLLTKF